MPRANITVTIPEGVWIGDVSRAHPDASVRILAAHAEGETGVGLVEITGEHASEVVADVEASESVTDLETIQRYSDTLLLQFETTVPLLLLLAQDSGVPIPMPFTIEAGEAEWVITAPQDRLSELGEQFEAFGVPFTVNEIRQHVEPETLLTDRQLRLLTAAVDRGYYDTPRECTLTELASEVGLAKSTCSETLHRVEEKIIKRFVDDFDGVGDPARR
jgi:predicted DNA binding protein